MPIAIFRHWKLSLAVPVKRNPTILNFRPRRMRELQYNKLPNQPAVVSLAFTRIDRFRNVVLNHDDLWEFQDGVFTFTRRLIRNGSIVKESQCAIPPAYTTMWADNGILSNLHKQFEQQHSARTVIERYLHQYTPNPFGYQIIQLNLNPETAKDDYPDIQLHLVPPMDIVELNAKVDRSEDSYQWSELFLG